MGSQQNKTQPTTTSVREYLNGVEDPRRRKDAESLLELIKEATHVEPMMWGTSIIGFGTHHYVYETGREGDVAAVGFSARKNALAVYGLRTEENEPLLRQLNTKETRGCVYISSLEKVDMSVLKQIISNAFTVRSNA